MQERKKRIARQAKIRRVRELPRLRKRYIKSGRGGEEREGRGNQDIVKLTNK